MNDKLWVYFFTASLFISGLYLLFIKPVSQHEVAKKNMLLSSFIFSNVPVLQYEVRPFLLRVLGVTMIGTSLLLVWMIVQGY